MNTDISILNKTLSISESSRVYYRNSKLVLPCWWLVVYYLSHIQILQPHVRLLCPWDFPGKNTEVVAISFSKGSSWPRDWTQVSSNAGRFFTDWATVFKKFKRHVITSIDTEKYLTINIQSWLKQNKYHPPPRRELAQSFISIIWKTYT